MSALNVLFFFFSLVLLLRILAAELLFRSARIYQSEKRCLDIVFNTIGTAYSERRSFELTDLVNNQSDVENPQSLVT